MDQQHWDVEDLKRASKMVTPSLFKAHRHEQPLLGLPLTKMSAAGLIKAEPCLTEGYPHSWIISLTPFGQAVRDQMALPA